MALVNVVLCGLALVFGFGPYSALGINIGLHATAGTATEIHGDMVRGYGHHGRIWIDFGLRTTIGT